MAKYQCFSANESWRAIKTTIENDDMGFQLNSVVGRIRLGPNTKKMQNRIEKTLDDSQFNFSENEFLLQKYSKNEAKPCCGIIEVIDECEVQCKTCIANSLPGTGNKRSTKHVEDASNHFANHNPRAPIMLSGGEPTLHPNIIDIVKSLRNHRNPIYLITNGIKIANSPEFVRDLFEANPDLIIYLQFDSMRSRDLEVIRAPQINAIVRQRSIENLENIGLKYILISVVMKGINDDIVGETINVNINNDNLLGITFQPVKIIGRNESATIENTLCTADLEDIISSQCGIEMYPHPENPLNWSSSVRIGNSWRKLEKCDSLYSKEALNKQISIVWHSALDNYVAESCWANPIVFVTRQSLIPLEIHYSQ